MHKVWNPAYETMPRQAIQKLQLERLQSQLRRLYDAVPFYRQTMRDAKTTPDTVRSLEDVTRLPYTPKQDLRDNYPFGLLAVPATRYPGCTFPVAPLENRH